MTHWEIEKNFKTNVLFLLVGFIALTAMFVVPTYALERYEDEKNSVPATVKTIEDEGKTYALITRDGGETHCLATSRNSAHAERLEEINEDYFETLEVVEIDAPIESIKMADIEMMFATGE